MNKSKVTILGLDPGLETTGYGVIACDGNQVAHVAGATIKTTPGDVLGHRLDVIQQRLREIIAEHQPRVVAMESLFFARNATSGLKVAQAQGILNLVCHQCDLPLFEYTPLQVKMALTGYGRADKKQIQAAVQKLLQLPKPPKPVDCADALAVALLHHRRTLESD